jgi:hypothetical protein
MAISLEIGVGDLLTEFLADALIVLGALEATGAVTALGFKTFFDGLYYFFVFVESDLWLHCFYSFVFYRVLTNVILSYIIIISNF